MKNILAAVKRKIKNKLKKIVGFDELEHRLAKLEEVATNIDIAMQVDNGLRYLNLIRTDIKIQEETKE